MSEAVEQATAGRRRSSSVGGSPVSSSLSHSPTVSLDHRKGSSSTLKKASQPDKGPGRKS